MSDHAAVWQFKGNTARLTMTMLLYLGLFAAVSSFGLMGGQWAPFFLFSLAIVLPMALAIAGLSAWTNRFRFDDDAQCIVKPGRPPVPYSDVTGIFLSRRGRTVDAFIKRGWRGASFLVEALPVAEEPRLAGELSARFPGLQVRTKRWGTSVAALTLLALLTAGFGAAHAWLYLRTPQLALQPRPPAWELDEKARKRPPHEYLEGFAFVLPAGVKLVSDQEDKLYFEDRANRLKIKAVSNIQRPELASFEKVFRRALGVRDYYELLDLSHRSRAGIIPLFLRTRELQDLEDAAVVRLSPPFLRGYITQGKRDGEEVTHVVLVGEQQFEEIHFFVTGPKRAPEQFIRTIVSGARLIGTQRAL